MKILVGLLVLLIFYSHSAEKVEFFSGVKLEKPDGFTVSEDYDGFIQMETQSSIIIMSFPLPESPAERQKALDQTKNENLLEGLVKQGITSIQSETVAVAGDDQALLVTGTQTVLKKKLNRIVLVLHFEDKTILIHATYPSDDSILHKAMMDSIKSTEPLSDTDNPNSLTHAFTFDTVAGLQVVKGSLDMPNTVTMSVDGKPTDPKNGKPYVSIVASLGPVTAADKVEYATMLFKRLNYLNEIELQEIKEKATAELPSVEIVAHATDSESGKSLLVYQMVKFRSNGHYFRIVGMVERDKASTYLNKIKQIAYGVKESDEYASNDSEFEAALSDSTQTYKFKQFIKERKTAVSIKEINDFMQSKSKSSRHLPGGLAKHTWEFDHASSQQSIQAWFDKNKMLKSYHIGDKSHSIEGCYEVSNSKNKLAIDIKQDGEASFMRVSTKDKSTSRSIKTGRFTSVDNEFKLSIIKFSAGHRDITFSWLDTDMLYLKGAVLIKGDPEVCSKMYDKVYMFGS
ncbi:hypothetical protein [Marinicella rhabdoformis]|uniref:hypothetical protein n=1 Tax=Marinicella rhabdoformis TaxID=2580566 RepID=UPI0012AEDF76|nr:hypothetical protein [Marinicella rhabdoformis]